jgi:ubiquinone/menaquinone biosynthesis C-methylase UbiE
MDPKAHWEGVYTRRSATEVSWYQPHAERSLALIRRIAGGKPFRLIDVGGGASTLVDDLLGLPGADITVLDISEAALDVARERLGARAGRVRWLAGDVTAVPLPAQAYDLWHDRAVFHFLTEPAQRDVYVAQVRHAVRPGGQVIVAAFGPEGPLQCSGLPVVRYAPDALHAQFGSAFELVGHETELHHTPGGAVQQFVYCLCVMHSSPAA